MVSEKLARTEFTCSFVMWDLSPKSNFSSDLAKGLLILRTGFCTSIVRRIMPDVSFRRFYFIPEL
jgi:hypothetical protein